MFLQIISTTGTTAACHFTRNFVLKYAMTSYDNYELAVGMLTRLPMYVKEPSEELLLEMEELLKVENLISLLDIHQPAILCFSSLIRKTYIHQKGEITSPLLKRYLNDFLDHVKSK